MSDEKKSLIHFAQVNVRECMARRHQRKFATHLLNCAIRATCEALKMRRPVQTSLDLIRG